MDGALKCGLADMRLREDVEKLLRRGAAGTLIMRGAAGTLAIGGAAGKLMTRGAAGALLMRGAAVTLLIRGAAGAGATEKEPPVRPRNVQLVEGAGSTGARGAAVTVAVAPEVTGARGAGAAVKLPLRVVSRTQLFRLPSNRRPKSSRSPSKSR